MLTKANHKQQNAMDMVSANGRELLQFNLGKFAKEASTLTGTHTDADFLSQVLFLPNTRLRPLVPERCCLELSTPVFLETISLSPVHPLLLLSFQLKRVPCMNL